MKDMFRKIYKFKKKANSNKIMEADSRLEKKNLIINYLAREEVKMNPYLIIGENPIE